MTGLLIGLLHVVLNSFLGGGSPRAAKHFLFPRETGSILVLVDHLPSKPDFPAKRAEQVMIGLRYLTTRTSWAYVDEASVESVSNASAVVYLGLNGLDPVSSAALTRLRAAHRLIISQYHLAEIREAGIAFEDVGSSDDAKMPDGANVEYRKQDFPVSEVPDYIPLQARRPAHVLASYRFTDGTDAPYIVTDGDALFINAPLSFMFDDKSHGTMLAACDAIAEFLGVPASPKPVAMLRLEDVSGLTPWTNLAFIARYLWQAGVPYGIGVIPDLHVNGVRKGALQDDAALVAVLQWAQDHGATIILHGLHHCCSSLDEDGDEGYEFWDHQRNAPIPGDSTAWMRSMIREGLSDEKNLGLHPTMWETPHYQASPADYHAVAEFFPVAWERREPTDWLPWALRRDQYGSLILPENLGYVSHDGTHTVAQQLAQAKEMLACRYCLAAAFFHPTTVSVHDVSAYVEGMRNLGYTFADPSLNATPRVTS